MLAPPHDYKMIGKPDAYYKWSVTQDGFIKRAEGAIYGPLDSSDSTKTGVTIFDPRTALPTGVWPTKVKPLHNRFSDYKASLHGSYGRSVNVAAWDRTSQRGFSMSALAVGHGLGSIKPSAAEYNMTWVLGRIAPATGAAMNTTVEYQYFRAGNSVSGAAAVQNGQDPGLFYGELLRVSFVHSHTVYRFRWLSCPCTENHVRIDSC